MDKCLDTALNEQRSMAHGAIDMDDWSKAQEVLAIAKRNISLIDDLKAKFAEYKKSVMAAEETIGGSVKASENANESAAAIPEEKAAVTPDTNNSVETTEANEEFLVQLEELVNEFPFAMAVCNEAAGIGANFTYDNAEADNMKKPAKLSNSMWVDTAVSKSKAEELIRALREYCANRN